MITRVPANVKDVRIYKKEGGGYTFSFDVTADKKKEAMVMFSMVEDSERVDLTIKSGSDIDEKGL